MKPFLLLSALACAISLQAAPPVLPDATPAKLPRWRGFNLLEKFNAGGGQKPFREEDFQWISELGFNFVRLPMDYRLWIKDGDWEKFNEEAFAQIDQAVEWGRRYGVHVCLNFHRAPGYTVAAPPEPKSLWTDPDAQRVCALHWAAFARRYRGVPSAQLSFNLLNEPQTDDRAAFVAVMRKLADAIHAEDPKRLIICDGLKWGSAPVEELAELGVASATRGYTPFEISHYKANWVKSDGFPAPAWPMATGTNGVLIGNWKQRESQPIVISGPFPSNTALRLHVGSVSSAAQLVVDADGKRVFEKAFRCGPGEGEWKRAEFQQQWNTYQNLYDRDYLCVIPQGARQVEVRVLDGDWLELTELGVRAEALGGSELTLKMRTAYGEKSEPLRYEADATGPKFFGFRKDRVWLWRTTIEPWKQAEARGLGIIVGEWGAFNRTPHETTLHWAEDCLHNWKDAGWGWALWNFRGSFGVLDSGRADVTYEEFHGHKLDRKLLELLQRY